MKVFHKSMWGVVLFFSLSTLSVSARLDRVDIETVTARLLRTLEMRFCFISFVRTSGQDYLIKQKKSNCFRKIVSVVRDAITAEVAESFGDIAHQVDIIPAGVEFPGKPRTDWPATIILLHQAK